MKKTFLLFIALIALTVTGCHNDSEYDLLPLGAADFISQYWPDPYIESVTTPSKGETQVVVKNGPTIVFGSNNEWVEIDGNGMPLPQVLLFDQLPPKIYQYLQETGQLNAVFAVRRDSTEYALTLLDQNLRYDIASGELTGTAPTSETPARQPR